jgi:hypothetical protein
MMPYDLTKIDQPVPAHSAIDSALAAMAPEDYPEPRLEPARPPLTHDGLELGRLLAELAGAYSRTGGYLAHGLVRSNPRRTREVLSTIQSLLASLAIEPSEIGTPRAPRRDWAATLTDLEEWLASPWGNESQSQLLKRRQREHEAMLQEQRRQQAHFTAVFEELCQESLLTATTA